MRRRLPLLPRSRGPHRRRTVGVALLVLGVALGPAVGPAAAADEDPAPARFRACPAEDLLPVACTRVAVPRSRSTPGADRVRLAVARASARSRTGRPVEGRRPTRRSAPEAVLYLTGGPGQHGTPLLEDLEGDVRPLLRRRDLLSMDTRGTGSASDLVLCPEVQGGEPRIPASVLDDCARRFGGFAGDYGTGDVVADIEAVRRATGYARLLVVGVSYGTYAAQRYARAHPERVSGLVLDSPLPAGPVEPFGVATAAALPRTLGEVCRLGRCGAARDVAGTLAAVQARLPLTADSATLAGGRGPSVVDADRLLVLGISADLDPVTRATVPGALYAARRGDAAPLARLGRDTGVVPGRLPEPDGGDVAASASELNVATFLATSCRDGAFPWDAATPPGAARRAAAEDAAGRIDPARAGGFDGGTLLRTSATLPCTRWPADPDRTPAGAPPPAPTLVLSGTADARTPLEDARRVAAAYPAGRLVSAPGEGHAVLGGRSRCSRAAIEAFAVGRRPPRCRANVGPARALPTPPASALGLARSRRGRALATARLTVADGARLTIASLYRSVAVRGRAALRDGEQVLAEVPGLRGGRLRVTDQGVLLDRFGYVGGTSVDGTLRPGRATVVLRVRGRGVGSSRVRIANPVRTADALERRIERDLGLGRSHRLRLAARLASGRR